MKLFRFITMASVYETVQSINFNVYTWFGYWQTDSKNRYRRFFYSIYSNFVIFMTSLYTVLQMVDLKDSWGNVEEVSNNLSATSTSIFSLSKVYVLKHRLDRVEKLREKFREHLNVPGIGVSEEDKQILQGEAESFMKTCKFMYGLISLTILCWCTAPMFQGLLPVRLWMPLDVERDVASYVLVYFYQSVLLVYFAAIVITADLILWSFIFQLCAHFRILRKNIAKYGSDNPEERNRKFCEIVRHHQEILKVSSEVDAVFRLTNLILLIGVAILISVSEFDLIQKTSSMDVRFLRQAGNIASAFFDLFMHSYYGTRLRNMSVGIANAIYSSAWLSLNNSERRDLMFVMVRSQRKCAITAGKIVDINLETYLSILSTSYNLLAVLRQTGR